MLTSFIEGDDMKTAEVKIFDSLKSSKFTIPLENQLNMLKFSKHDLFERQIVNGVDI